MFATLFASIDSRKIHTSGNNSCIQVIFEAMQSVDTSAGYDSIREVTSPIFELLYVSSFEFEVGDNSGWVVPPAANDSKIYNNWASDKRFKVGDTIRFKYKKDSVMEVREAGYKKCNSTRPKFFSNNGNTIIKLDHPGFYYFISGSYGHCQRGQRMIIQVMSHDHDHTSDDSSSSGGTSSSAAAAAAAAISLVGVSKFVGVQSLLLFLASSLF